MDLNRLSHAPTSFRHRSGSVSHQTFSRPLGLTTKTPFGFWNPRHAAITAAQKEWEDWPWIHPLPPKILQTHLSSEERALLQCRERGLIADAADQAVYKWKTSRSSQISSAPSTDLDDEHLTRRSSISSLPSSDCVADSAIDMDEEGSLYDSFRWLDGDSDLDLTLDDYHKHILHTVSTSKPSVRTPSFRRTFSLNRHQSVSNFSQSVPRDLHSSRSATLPLQNLPNQSTRNTAYRQHQRTPSQPLVKRHHPSSSVSSVDPSAQYVHDPEARLKLRVYLASPQKFDEAIEFGFPFFDGKENGRPGPIARDVQPSAAHEDPLARTFLDDETVIQAPADGSTPVRKPTQGNGDADIWSSLKNHGFQHKPSAWSQVGRHREMTLKMTLTRPDLRSVEESSFDPSDDPLRLADLPPPGITAHCWADMPDRSGVMKKMWRRIRMRKA